VKAQVTLTVNEAKRLIAKAIVSLPEVRVAKEKGKILLGGGTTVSAVAEELVGLPLRISGRVTPAGTRVGLVKPDVPNNVLIEKGQVINVDERLEETAAMMAKGDVAIIGANALDMYGNTALMCGGELGAHRGRAFSGLVVEGVTILIAVGLEKLIPDTIRRAVLAAGRKDSDLSMGMSVGLLPIPGKVITEVEALAILAQVTPTVIGRGGVMGAEGATTLVIEGQTSGVEKALEIIGSIKGAALSGNAESLPQCYVGSPACSRCKGLACLIQIPG